MHVDTCQLEGDSDWVLKVTNPAATSIVWEDPFPTPRLTNGFSKKVESPAAMVVLYTVFYNFCQVHKSLRVTPAMQARITDHIWDMEEVVGHTDVLAPKPADEPRPRR